MKKIFLGLIALLVSATVFAVPAKRGWQTVTQADGTTIEVQHMGDEFYHYTINREGKQIQLNEKGIYEIAGEKPTKDQVIARRAKSPRLAAQVQPRKNYGAAQPTKLLVLLVNFSDKKMTSAHNNAFFNTMLNGSSSSVRDYFNQSSDGKYVPDFEVFGPYTLSNNMAYYGGNDSNGDDLHPDQMVVDACALAAADGCDFSHFDQNNDNIVDNIYVIYAGYGEAAGAPANTIWPHSWEIYSSNVTGTLTYNGKTLGHYACSAELSGKSGSNSDGIGTFCHEFSHVIGLPDYYDTDYGTNSDNYVTPGEWTLMDQGSYNGNGQYPPLYSIYDKYFMGWATPTILKDPENVNMPVGTAYARQITSSNTLAAVTNTNTNYYLENRQQSGYDSELPGHGMIVWKVTYNATRWNSNDLNNTAGTLRYTIVPADGKTKNYGASDDPFPGTDNITSYTPITGHALTDIKETSKVITFKYNGGISGHSVIVDGTGCQITPSATTVENGEALTATITPTDATYDFTSLTVKLGSTTLTSGTHYTLSSDKKSLTINASAITGAASNDLTITAVWTKNRYNYAMLGEDCTEELEGMVNKNAALNLTITPNSGYTLANAACWDVSMGGTALTYGTDFTYNAGTNTFSIASVTGDVEIYAYGGIVVTWNSLGDVFDTNIAINGKIALPTTTPTPCSGKEFMGWCTNATYSGNSAPTFAKDNDVISAATTYYAVFATLTGGSGASTETKYTFTSASWATSQDAWTSNGSGNGHTSGQGVQVTTGKSGAGAETTASQSNVTKVVVEYCTNASKGAGSIEIAVGSENISKEVTSTGGTTLRELEFDFDNASGKVSIDVTCTTNSIYINSITITSGGGGSYTAYTTDCVPPTMYNINISALTHGSLSTSPSAQATNGETVTITATPDEWYNLATLTVNSGAVTVNGTGNTRTFTMPEADVTIAATFTEVAKHTVRFLVNGTAVSTQQVHEGQAPEVPTPSAIDGFTFIGWWTAELAQDNTEAKEWISDFAVTTNTDFHAVFSYYDETGGGEATWNLVTDASSLQAGDILVIASTTKGKTAAELSGTYLTEASSTFGTGTITSLGSGTIEFTLGGTEGEWTLTSSEGVLGSSAAKNVNWGSGTTTWTISISGDNATIYSGNSGYGRILHNVGSTRFTTYTSQVSTSMLLPQLYRKTGGGTTYYTTSCETPTEVTVTFNANEGTGTMTDQTIPYNEATALKANTFTREGYSFAGWATTANGTVVYADQASVTLTKNTTLFAKWNVNSYTINLAAVEHGSLSTSPSASANFGATVTITATPDANYELGSISVVNANSEQVALTGNTFTMPASNVTVSATFTEKAKYTINFYVNGSIEKTQTLHVDEIATAPSVDACDGFTFKGWVTAAIATETTVAPSYITDFTVNGAQNYYAVFSRVEAGGTPVLTDNYEKITSTADLETGNYIVVGYKNGSYAMKNTTVNTNYIAQQSVTPHANIISTTNSAIIWKLTINSNQVSFYNEAVSKYIYIYTSGTKKYLGLTTSTSENINFTYSVEDGWWKFINTGIDGYYLEYYGDKSDFSAYTSAGTDPIYLYKQQSEIPSTTYYSTSCVEPTKYGITISPSTHGSLETTPATEAAAGRTVTVTATPATHYHLATLTVKDADNASVTVSGEGNTRSFVMPEKAVTISATFDEDTKYTVEFSNKGTTITSTSYYLGEEVTLPADPSAGCDAYTFVGWWTSQLDSSNTTAQTWITANFNCTGNQTFYAIYSKTEDGGSSITSYNKVTAEPTDWSGNYLIVNETAGVAFTGISASGQNDAIAISDGVIAYSEDLAKDEVIIAPMTNGYSVQINSEANNNAGKYLYGTSGSNAMSFDTSEQLNTLAYSGGNVTITSNTSVLRYNNNTTSGDLFRYYKSSSYSTQQPIQLYKKVTTSSSTTYYSSSVSCSATDIESLFENAPKATKVLYNGQVVIIRDGVYYTILGQPIK